MVSFPPLIQQVPGLLNISADLRFEFRNAGKFNFRAQSPDKINLNVPVVYPGIKIQDVDFELVDSEGKVIVNSVIKGGSAERAGIVPGSILDKVDGWTIVCSEMARLIMAQNGRHNAVKLEFDAGPYGFNCFFLGVRDDGVNFLLPL